MNDQGRLAAGTVFAGDFRIVRPLKAGGMGEVYVAEQISTGKQRALKLMLPEVVEKPALRKRFDLEAKVGAKIKSEHVVEVIAAGVHGHPGIPWLAMELLEGETLEAYLARVGPLPPAEVRVIFDQLCHALGEAHRADIVHRDLKPENIFLAIPRRRGEARFFVKVLDFGIARLVAEVKTTSSRTRPGLGTPRFMAPEQMNLNVPVGPPADVWALGLIAFELLTGRAFWKTISTPESSVQMLITEVLVTALPSASARAADLGCRERIPPGFDAWLRGCVAREASERFADADQAFAALESVLKSAEGASVSPVRPPLPPTDDGDAPPPPVPPPLPPPVPLPGPPVQPGTDVMRALPAEVVSERQARRGPTMVETLPKRRVPPQWFALGFAGAAVAAISLGAALWPKGGPKPEPSATPSASSATPPVPPPPPPLTCPEGTVLIPAGTFQMGSPDGEGDSDEHPRHEVTLSAYCMDRTEVTVAQYRRCVKEGRGGVQCAAAPTTVKWEGADVKLWSQFCNGDRADRDNHPINCMEWNQAATYCRWAGGRLPTEAEWEYAAGGTDSRKYPWGKADPGPTLLNACGGECRTMGARLGQAWKVMYEGNDGWETTAEVGKFPLGASPFGLLDMAGNVWEWTSDVQAPYAGAALVNPKIETGPDMTRRVIRGGAWVSYDASRVRVAYRDALAVSDRDNGVGFRCARGSK